MVNVVKTHNIGGPEAYVRLENPNHLHIHRGGDSGGGEGTRDGHGRHRGSHDHDHDRDRDRDHIHHRDVALAPCFHSDIPHFPHNECTWAGSSRVGQEGNRWRRRHLETIST